MAGNLIVGPRSMPQPQYAGEPFDTAGLWVGEQVNSVEALVQKSADVLYAPGVPRRGTEPTGSRSRLRSID